MVSRDSSSVLTVDCGNSRVKASLFKGESLVASTAMDTLSAHETIALWNGEDAPAGGILCCVGHTPKASEVESLSDALSGQFLVFNHSTPLPVGIRYDTPETLGLDRIAGACGAASMYPGESVLVADAGTALTLDIVDGGATFRGGNISPGVSLRLRALNGFTSALPLVEKEGRLYGFGRDTETALRGGAVGGTADEIIAAALRGHRNFGVTRLLLTGGDARLLLPILSDYTSRITDFPEIRLCPDIVGRGLVSIFNHNR